MASNPILLLLGLALGISAASSQDTTSSSFDSSTPLEVLQGSVHSSFGQPAPPIRFHTISDNNAHDLRESVGSVVMLNFWATWCKPCKSEMPEISLLQDDYHGAGLRVLFLSTEDCQTQKHFFESSQTSGLKGCVDGDNLLKPYQTVAIPMTILIDRSGIIRDGWLGAIGYDAIEARLNTFLPRGQKRFFASIHRLGLQLKTLPSYVHIASVGVFLILIGLASSFIKRRNANKNTTLTNANNF